MVDFFTKNGNFSFLLLINIWHSTNLQYKLETTFSVFLKLSNPLKLQIQLKFKIDPLTPKSD